MLVRIESIGSQGATELLTSYVPGAAGQPGSTGSSGSCREVSSTARARFTSPGTPAVHRLSSGHTERYLYLLGSTATDLFRRFAWTALASLLNTFCLRTANFGAIYWHYGTTRNFNVTMSRWTLSTSRWGTLTTAGTGNIAPVSQLARRLVSMQMVLDFILVAGGVSLAITMLGEKIPKMVNGVNDR